MQIDQGGNENEYEITINEKEELLIGETESKYITVRRLVYKLRIGQEIKFKKVRQITIEKVASLFYTLYFWIIFLLSLALHFFLSSGYDQYEQ